MKMLKTMFSEQNRNLHDDNGIYLHIWLQKLGVKAEKNERSLSRSRYEILMLPNIHAL
jgi:hypothetical protein